jgi:hypothetical protein
MGRVTIEGRPQPGTEELHQKTMAYFAATVAEGGLAERIALDRPINSILGENRCDPNIRADITIVQRGSRLIDMVEVRSPNQTRKELQDKLEKAMGQLPPNRQGRILILEPGQGIVPGVE